MARSRRSSVTVQRTVSLPAVYRTVRLPTFTAPDISYIQHVTRQLDAATVRDTVRRQIKVTVPVRRPKTELPGTRSFRPVALLGHKDQKTPKQKLCKCLSSGSDRQREVSRKFFQKFGARRSGGGSARPRVHACPC